MQKYAYRKLRGRIIEMYGTMDAFSKHINRSKVSVSNKMTGNSGFSQEDIETWGEALDIPMEQYGPYFFA